MAQEFQRSNSTDIGCLEDSPPPVGSFLSGKYKKSFAYVTLKDRLPVILTKIIDGLSRNKDVISAKYGNGAIEEIKQITGSISKLKNELVTNKEIIFLVDSPSDDENDALKWNQYLEELMKSRGEIQTWFNTIWLFCECYMYRRLAQSLALTNHLRSYDPFEIQKQESFFQAKISIGYLLKYTLGFIDKKMKLNEEEQQETFTTLLKLSLWGNRCDLSLSTGDIESQSNNQLDLLEILDKFILVDNSVQTWEGLLDKCKKSSDNAVDIILDNAGYELFTDLCLAVYLTKVKSIKIIFHAKKYPWFISDVMKKDFFWLIKTMSESHDGDLKNFGTICTECLNLQLWKIEDEAYWTGPYDYSGMVFQDKKLYDKLSQSCLIVFKGDLNYRKLLGDINWDHTTNFEESLRDFKPSTNLVALRTLKADLCCGLTVGATEILNNEDPDWMTTGKFGLIQALIR